MMEWTPFWFECTWTLFEWTEFLIECTWTLIRYTRTLFEWIVDRVGVHSDLNQVDSDQGGVHSSLVWVHLEWVEVDSGLIGVHRRTCAMAWEVQPGTAAVPGRWAWRMRPRTGAVPRACLHAVPPICRSRDPTRRIPWSQKKCHGGRRDRKSTRLNSSHSSVSRMPSSA